jgi:hypothetical protein
MLKSRLLGAVGIVAVVGGIAKPKRAWLAAITALIVFFAILPEGRAQGPTKPRVLPHLTILGFTLGKNTIADVQAKLGASTIGQCSNDEGANKVICYVSPDSDKTTIFFEAGVSGGWSQLGGFRIISGARSPNCRLACTASKAVGRDVQTRGGLKLGLTRTEVLSLLGTPVRTAEDKLAFEWLSRRPMTKQEIAKSGQNPVVYAFWNIVDTIDVALANSKVVEFEIGHAVSN